jgi:type VI secretion system protein ImpL
MAALDKLRSLATGSGSSAPGLGLSQAEKLGAQAARAYRNALHDALLPRVAMALEDDLRDGLRGPKPRAGLGESLAAYVSLYEGKPDSASLEAATLRLWRLPEAAQASLAAHLRAGLGTGPPDMRHPADEAIIKATRQLLGAGKTS